MATFRNASIALKRKQTHPFDVQRGHDINFRKGFEITNVNPTNSAEINHKFNFPFRGDDLGPLYVQLSEFSFDMVKSMTGSEILGSMAPANLNFDSFNVEWMMACQTEYTGILPPPPGVHLGTDVSVYSFTAKINSLYSYMVLPYLIVNSTNEVLLENNIKCFLAFNNVTAVFTLVLPPITAPAPVAIQIPNIVPTLVNRGGSSRSNSIFNFGAPFSVRNESPTDPRIEIVVISFSPEIGPEFTRIIETKSEELANEQASLLLVENDETTPSSIKSFLPTDMCYTNFYTDYAMAARRINPSILFLLFRDQARTNSNNIVGNGYLCNLNSTPYSLGGGNMFGVLPLCSNYGTVTVFPDKRSLDNNLFQRPRDPEYGCVPPAWTNSGTGFNLKRGVPSAQIATPRGFVRGAPFLFDLSQPTNINPAFVYLINEFITQYRVPERSSLYSYTSPFQGSDMNEWSNLYNNVPLGYCAAAVTQFMIRQVLAILASRDNSRNNYVNVFLLDGGTANKSNQNLSFTSDLSYASIIPYINNFINFYRMEMLTFIGVQNQPFSFTGSTNFGIMDPNIFSMMVTNPFIFPLQDDCPNMLIVNSLEGAPTSVTCAAQAITMGTIYNNPSNNSSLTPVFSTVASYDYPQNIVPPGLDINRFPVALLQLSFANAASFYSPTNYFTGAPTKSTCLQNTGIFSNYYEFLNETSVCSGITPMFNPKSYFISFHSMIQTDLPVETTPSSFSSTGYGLGTSSVPFFGNGTARIPWNLPSVSSGPGQGVQNAPILNYKIVQLGPFNSIFGDNIVSAPQYLSYNDSQTKIPWNFTNIVWNKNSLTTSLNLFDSLYFNFTAFEINSTMSNVFGASGNSVLLTSQLTLFSYNIKSNRPPILYPSPIGGFSFQVSHSPLIMPATNRINNSVFPTITPDPNNPNVFLRNGMSFFENISLNPSQNPGVLASNTVVPSSQASFSNMPFNAIDATYDFDSPCFTNFNSLSTQTNVYVPFQGPYMNNIMLRPYVGNKLTVRNYSFIPKRDVGCIPVTLSMGFNSVPPANDTLFGYCTKNQIQDFARPFALTNFGGVPFCILGGFNQGVSSLKTLYEVNPLGAGVPYAIASLNIMNSLPTTPQTLDINCITAPMLVPHNPPNLWMTEYSLFSATGLSNFFVEVTTNTVNFPENQFKSAMDNGDMFTFSYNFSLAQTNFKSQVFHKTFVADQWLNINQALQRKIEAYPKVDILSGDIEIVAVISPICQQIPNDTGTGLRALTSYSTRSVVHLISDILPPPGLDLVSFWLQSVFAVKVSLLNIINYNCQYYPLVRGYNSGDMSSGFQGLIFGFYFNNVPIESENINFYDLKCSFAQRDIEETRVGGKRYERGDPQHY